MRGFSPPAQRALCQQWEQLRLVEGTLYRNFEDADGHCRLQLIVPMALRSDILKQMHKTSAREHLGEEKKPCTNCMRGSTGQVIRRTLRIGAEPARIVRKERHQAQNQGLL